MDESRAGQLRYLISTGKVEKRIKSLEGFLTFREGALGFYNVRFEALGDRDNGKVRVMVTIVGQSDGKTILAKGQSVQEWRDATLIYPDPPTGVYPFAGAFGNAPKGVDSGAPSPNGAPLAAPLFDASPDATVPNAAPAPPVKAEGAAYFAPLAWNFGPSELCVFKDYKDKTDPNRDKSKKSDDKKDKDDKKIRTTNPPRARPIQNPISPPPARPIRDPMIPSAMIPSALRAAIRRPRATTNRATINRATINRARVTSHRARRFTFRPRRPKSPRRAPRRPIRCPIPLRPNPFRLRRPIRTRPASAARRPTPIRPTAARAAFLRARAAPIGTAHTAAIRILTRIPCLTLIPILTRLRRPGATVTTARVRRLTTPWRWRALRPKTISPAN